MVQWNNTIVVAQTVFFKHISLCSVRDNLNVVDSFVTSFDRTCVAKGAHAGTD